GAIGADYITTGTMYADRIKGGTLTVGGYNNDNGVIEVRNNSGDVICLFDQNGADILGTIKTHSIDGYWLNLENGNLIGGQGDNRYTTINATGQITDADNNITYNGLLVESDAIDFRCRLFAINGGTGTSGGMTLIDNLELSYSDIEVITNAWIDENGYLQTERATISYLSGYSINSTTYYFTNGIMTTSLN
ncbi:MAG: hypothetical protein K2H89_02505, partial [Oscillospiraceae bacterium]|nr:hypothetical protein [Oscillospiraceae bacterium]